ncbi:MAG: M28 family peptidase [Acidobacteriota bacterium]
MKRSVLIVSMCCLVAAVGAGLLAQTRALPVASPAIDIPTLLTHVKVMSSDQYEGRAPGTRGEDLTVAYIEDQFRKAGLKPGNPDGTYIQKVPMVGITPDPATSLTFSKGSATQTLKFKEDVVAWTKRAQPRVSVDTSDIVFVGYGVQAPEYAWDDYKGVDLAGKTLIVLVGDPPVADPADPAKLDPKMFGGRAMTYYGRWTYKFEMGAEKKAAAVLIVHETGPAGYPFSVVQGKVGEQFDLVTPDKGARRPAIEGWITLDQAKALCRMAGQEYEALKKQAVTRAFKPVAFGVTASMTIANTIRTIDSRNVAGKVDGSDPALKDEYVVFTSHWDHFGIGAAVNGDTIYHGALDNATGVGGLIELGRAYAALPVAPKRSMLLLSVTAEEQGLLGSDYYATHPLYPLRKTLAVINMDALNVYGKTRDMRVVGLGNSDLDDYARAAAAEQGRQLAPDPKPEDGGYFRSDHFPFARQGVPAINAGGGEDVIGKPEGWARNAADEYTAKRYHQPSDVMRPEWDMAGAVQDLQIYFVMGYRVAQAATFPQWKPGTEFKARRDAMMAR